MVPTINVKQSHLHIFVMKLYFILASHLLSDIASRQSVYCPIKALFRQAVHYFGWNSDFTE